MAIAKKVVRSSSKAVAAPAKTNRKSTRVVEDEEEAPVKTTRAERVAAREAKKAAEAKAERIAAKKAAAAAAEKAAAKPKRKVKEVVEEVEEVESSQQILLTYVAEITGKKVTMTDTSYNVDGVEILRAQVVAMIGKTFYFRNTISLGTVADTQLVKGLTCVNTVEGDKVVLFDPTCIQLLTVEGGAAEAEGEEADGDDEVDGDDDDEVDGDDDDDDDGDEDGEVEGDDDDEGDDADGDDDDEGDDADGDDGDDDFEF